MDPTVAESQIPVIYPCQKAGIVVETVTPVMVAPSAMNPVIAAACCLNVKRDHRVLNDNIKISPRNVG
jgi:hypothetical protein